MTGTLAAFASFSVGFIARPFGGAVFAHYGDKIGRKPMLVYSLLLMGAATVLMGLLPGYASIGIWAPILLVVLRFASFDGASVIVTLGATRFVPENIPQAKEGDQPPIHVTTQFAIAPGCAVELANALGNMLKTLSEMQKKAEQQKAESAKAS